MLRLWNAISCLLLVSAVPAFSAHTQSFENSAIVRTVELGGSLVHVTTTFAVKALKADASVYTITIPAEEIYITNWLEVKVKGKQEPLTVTYSGSTGSVFISSLLLQIWLTLHYSKAHNLDVSLEKPLEVGETINLVLETVQTHATWPWPPQAAQKEEQALKYETSLFVLSRYITNVQRTKLKYVFVCSFTANNYRSLLQVFFPTYHISHNTRECRRFYFRESSD